MLIVKVDNLSRNAMARPDIKDARREQILDAFETCVATYGVEGATLAKTADEAGLARPLVRHNVGNRQELIDALVERFLERSRETLDGFMEALPKTKRAVAAIEWLFSPDYSDKHLAKISYALITSSADNPALAVRMQNWLDDFITRLTGLFSKEFPNANPEKIKAVATGITGIYFNVESFRTLGNIDALIASSKQAALMLLASIQVEG